MIRATLALIWLAAWLALCIACTDSDGETGMEQPACPDGREWTEWCGCEPPVYGDDC